MKIILLNEVENLGQRGQVVKVAPGYARNFLLPKKFAIPATPGNLRHVENQKLAWAKVEAREKDAAEVLARALADVHVSVPKKVGEGDNLYGSVTTMEIAAELETRGFSIDRRRIRLDHPIKTLGEYTIPIKLHSSVQAHIKLSVTREGAPAQPVETAEPAAE